MPTSFVLAQLSKSPPWLCPLLEKQSFITGIERKADIPSPALNQISQSNIHQTYLESIYTRMDLFWYPRIFQSFYPEMAYYAMRSPQSHGVVQYSRTCSYS